jgi:hypothetical protein
MVEMSRLAYPGHLSFNRGTATPSLHSEVASCALPSTDISPEPCKIRLDPDRNRFQRRGDPRLRVGESQLLFGEFHYNFHPTILSNSSPNKEVWALISNWKHQDSYRSVTIGEPFLTNRPCDPKSGE